MKFEKAYLAVLGFLTIEIIVRRLYWHQLPTQISAAQVYSLLVFNAFYIGWRFWKSKGVWLQKGKN